MLFSDQFVAEVEENPVVGIVKAIEHTYSVLENYNEQGAQDWNADEHDLLWEAVGFIDIVIQNEHLETGMKSPVPSGDIQENCRAASLYLNEIKDMFLEQSTKLRVQSLKSRYNALLKSTFAYEFSQGDLERIQGLLNELRGEISGSELLENSHKQRLLKRLERVQTELHKRVSDLDRLWGLVGDAGVVLGKLGKDAKPIVDRTREIAEIIWKTQARSEELPSDTKNPMLEKEEIS